MSQFRCHTCGEQHDGPPFAYVFDAPAAWSPTREVQPGNVLGPETCEMSFGDDRHFLVRGVIRVPVVGMPDQFEWGVWVSLAEVNYRRMLERWDDPRRADEPSYFGWLSSSIPVYPSTVDLKTAVHTRPVGNRPLIELEPTDHPLAIEQRAGITMCRVEEIAMLMLHPKEPPSASD